MASDEHYSRLRFKHRWATRICSQNPWYRRSANRIIEITVTQDQLCSRVMLPLFRFGFPDVCVQLSKVVAVERSVFWGRPTIKVTYLDDKGAIHLLEHAFTTLLPIPIVTNAGEAFLQIIEAARAQNA